MQELKFWAKYRNNNAPAYKQLQNELGREEQANETPGGGDRDEEDVCALPVTHRHRGASCMQRVISANFLQLTASIKLCAISCITTLNSTMLMLLI